MSDLRTRADAAAQVLVDDLEAPTLSDADAHHLGRVLRLRDGEQVVASDGAGSWRLCAMSGATLEPIAPTVLDPTPTDRVGVWLPAVKGDRAEWAVAKLTELGVDSIGLLSCERAAVRLDAAGRERVLERWRRVTREATCQSRRTRLPDLVGPLDVAAAGALGAVRCDLDGELAIERTRTLMVGPEGGWGDAERSSPSACVSLGRTVLRTETAAVAAGALLCRATRHDAVPEAQ